MCYHIIRCEFHRTCSQTTSEPHAGMYLKGNSFALQHHSNMFRILMLVLDNFILSLGFRSQDNYLPRDRKGYESFHSMIDPTAIILILICTQIQNRADMTNRLIRLGLSNHLSKPVRAKVKCCESHDCFSCQVTDCSATRIPSYFTLLQRCSWRILQPKLTGQMVQWEFMQWCKLCKRVCTHAYIYIYMSIHSMRKQIHRYAFFFKSDKSFWQVHF